VGLLALVDSRPSDPAEPLLEPGDSDLDAFLRAESGAREGDLPALRSTVRSHLRALRDYRPLPLACPVALFLAGERPHGETADRAGVWRPLAQGPFEVETVPGDHFQLLTEPAVEILGAKLLARLGKIDDQPA
jgi:surfactin synthase thioesterase subunit